MNYTALIGNPVSQSISHVLYAEIAKFFNIEYSHLKIKVETKNKLPEIIRSLKILGFTGINITLPFKRDIIPLCNKVSKDAKTIGAINTIVFTDDGKIFGVNTDSIGAVRAIEENLKIIEKNDNVTVIGSGGVARAIIFGFLRKGANVTIIGNNLQEGESLIRDFISLGNIQYYSLSNQNLVSHINASDFVINATPVGMYPNSQLKIINEDVFYKIDNIKDKYFFDAIFNPEKTFFLKYAENQGAKICSGLSMLLFQGIAAFEFWFKRDLKDLPTSMIYQILLHEIRKYESVDYQ